MPIHDLGYRPWNGKLKSMWSRLSMIANSGIALAGKNRWMRRILVVAWIPVLYWGVAFFLIGQSFEQPVQQAVSADQLIDAVEKETGVQMSLKQRDQLRQEIKKTGKFSLTLLETFGASRGIDVESLKKELGKRTNQRAAAENLDDMFRNIPGVRALSNSIRDAEDTSEARNRLWAWLLMTFFRYSQAFLILILIGTISPGLISHDLRSRAYLLYFSRPIGKLEYIVGKLAVPAFYIFLVSTFPALTLYLFGIMMSPNTEVIASTLDIPLRIILASLVLIIPTAVLSTALSSLTTESRFASFAWFGIWILGHGTWLTVLIGTAIRSNVDAAEVLNSDVVQRWSNISIYNTLGDVQSWIFGFKPFSDAYFSLAILIAITVIGLLVLFRRVTAPLRA